MSIEKIISLDSYNINYFVYTNIHFLLPINSESLKMYFYF